MNNPVSSFLRRPPPSSKCGASGSLQCADVSNLRKSSDKGDFHDVQKGKVVDERLDNEDEWNECSDWLSEAGEVARLTLIAPVSSIELIGKSLSQTADSDYAPASRGEQRIDVDWGSGEEWLEEIGHMLKLSLSAPVTCIELLGKSMTNPEDDKITI